MTVVERLKSAAADRPRPTVEIDDGCVLPQALVTPDASVVTSTSTKDDLLIKDKVHRPSLDYLVQSSAGSWTCTLCDCRMKQGVEHRHVTGRRHQRLYAQLCAQQAVHRQADQQQQEQLWESLADHPDLTYTTQVLLERDLLVQTGHEWQCRLCETAALVDVTAHLVGAQHTAATRSLYQALDFEAVDETQGQVVQACGIDGPVEDEHLLRTASGWFCRLCDTKTMPNWTIVESHCHGQRHQQALQFQHDAIQPVNHLASSALIAQASAGVLVPDGYLWICRVCNTKGMSDKSAEHHLQHSRRHQQGLAAFLAAEDVTETETESSWEDLVVTETVMQPKDEEEEEEQDKEGKQEQDNLAGWTGKVLIDGVEDDVVDRTEHDHATTSLSTSVDNDDEDDSFYSSDEESVDAKVMGIQAWPGMVDVNDADYEQMILGGMVEGLFTFNMFHAPAKKEPDAPVEVADDGSIEDDEVMSEPSWHDRLQQLSTILEESFVEQSFVHESSLLQDLHPVEESRLESTLVELKQGDDPMMAPELLEESPLPDTFEPMLNKTNTSVDLAISTNVSSELEESSFPEPIPETNVDNIRASVQPETAMPTNLQISPRKAEQARQQRQAQACIAALAFFGICL